jgi:Ran-binding protein 3
VIPGSFDASSLEDGDVKSVRLIMRQDSTHRVILNTTVIPAMTFQEKPMNKTVCVLFTAIEGAGEAVSVQLKVSKTKHERWLHGGRSC